MIGLTRENSVQNKSPSHEGVTLDRCGEVLYIAPRFFQEAFAKALALEAAFEDHTGLQAFNLAFNFLEQNTLEQRS